MTKEYTVYIPRTLVEKNTPPCICPADALAPHRFDPSLLYPTNFDWVEQYAKEHILKNEPISEVEFFQTLKSLPIKAGFDIVVDTATGVEYPSPANTQLWVEYWVGITVLKTLANHSKATEEYRIVLNDELVRYVAYSQAFVRDTLYTGLPPVGFQDRALYSEVLDLSKLDDPFVELVDGKFVEKENKSDRTLDSEELVDIIKSWVEPELIAHIAKTHSLWLAEKLYVPPVVTLVETVDYPEDDNLAYFRFTVVPDTSKGPTEHSLYSKEFFFRPTYQGELSVWAVGKR